MRRHPVLVTITSDNGVENQDHGSGVFALSELQLRDIDANMIRGWPLPSLRRRPRFRVGRLYATTLSEASAASSHLASAEPSTGVEEFMSGERRGCDVWRSVQRLEDCRT